MIIAIYKDFLPEDSTRKAAVVLELRIPSFLVAYRNIIFRIFSDLGHPSKPSTSSLLAILLKDYYQL